MSTLRNRIWQARDWFSLYNKKAQANDISEREYASYTKYADVILMSIEQTLLDIEQQDRKQPSWILKAAAAVAFTIGGYTMPVHALEVDAKPVNVTTKETKKDYVAELEAKVKDVKIEEGKDYKFYDEIGNRFNQTEKYVEALAYIRKAIAIDSENPSAHLNVAFAYRRLAEQSRKTGTAADVSVLLSNAIDEYSSCAKKADSLADTELSKQFKSAALTGLGLTYNDKGDLKEAKRYLTAASEIRKLTPYAQKILIALQKEQ